MSSSTGSDDDKVTQFPTTPEAHAKRVLTEAQRLANLTPDEWRLWIDRSAEQLVATWLRGLKEPIRKAPAKVEPATNPLM